jgi:enoyl-CoA hydratase/carnithine racemase
MISYADGALRLGIDGPIAELTLERPAARNALNLAMWRDLPVVMRRIEADDAIRVLIIGGAGGNFASGADIAEFTTVFADRTSALAYGRMLETATGAIAGLGKPVIAKVEGYCIGAGLAIALACDLRIAASDARFCAPPAKLGLIYSLADTKRLIDAVGASAAKAMLFTGAMVAADEAKVLRLVGQVHEPAALDGAVRALAQSIAAASPWSVLRTKAIAALIAEGATGDTDETRGWFADAAEGDDFAEGLAAFHGKRPPEFR